MKNLAPNLLPNGCSIYDGKGRGTNNIAEYAALYYGLHRFRKIAGPTSVIVYHDSELIVKQVSGEYRCKQLHLQPWLHAVKSIWWSNIVYEWVPRDIIVSVLGH